MKEPKKRKETKGGPVYEKPIIMKERTMTFPMDIINSLGYRISCTQCSSCHGCR